MISWEVLMDYRPLISVVIPVFNREKYLDESVASVFAQTYDHWELILVDDGSSDGSYEMELAYAAKHPGRIRCVTHANRENRGISASRNLGSREAKGEYIACLDSDDFWVPAKLEHQVSVLNKHPEVGLVVGATKYWHPGEPRLDQVLLAGGPRDEVIQPPRLFYEMYPMGEGIAPSMNTVLLRKDVFEKIGGWEESFRTSYEDQAMFCKVYLTEPVYISSELGDIYRQHAESIMKTELVGIRYFRKRYIFLCWLEQWIKKEHPDRIAEIKLVQEKVQDPELWPFRDPIRYNVLRSAKKIAKIAGKVTGWSGRT